ncbi:DEAD/DEAH box helicase [Arcanobacterium phocae]|uniref:DEAD/DEAH box helicase n=1 Tax=Arcanobacterium phocae TaxID=131112 RepID=UPI001C10480D|nr:DEAD/DEAH box helicase [Arcanobacterium phocae]
MDRLTLKKLYNTDFPKLYEMLLKNDGLSTKDLEKVLSIGIFLTSLEDENLQNLGYRLFLLYSKVTKDYKPLYELSLNKGLIPISQFIEKTLNYSEKFGNLYTTINSIANEEYKWSDSYQTLEQFRLFKNTIESKLESQIIVAPTSYGKTELMLSFIDHENFKNICIIAPTKSLLTQIKKRIINKHGFTKIVTYPEMYNEQDSTVLAVLTQERLLRLLQNNPNLKFDLLIIDEAHNLLDEFSTKNLRSVILTSVIIICNKRNSNIVCKYLTPFIKNKESLRIKYLPWDTRWYNVTETVKSELFYFYDLNSGSKMLLDQHSPHKDRLIGLSVDNLGKDSDVVIRNSSEKNIIYLNSPSKLEKFASDLYDQLPSKESSVLAKAASDLREYVHEKYQLAKYLERGIVYHHGYVPEPVRYFIEDLYAEIPEIRMLVANSTLLEGVNIPATRMFILDPSKGPAYLSASSFKNLIGRVCRFGEIFNKETGSLDYLLPEIHIVKGEFCRRNFNPNSFIKGRKILVEDSHNINDEVKNPLLAEYGDEDDDFKKAEEIIENISSVDYITENYENRPRTKVGKLCFENNVNIFNILAREVEIAAEAEPLTEARNLEETFHILDQLFFSKIDIEDDSLKRFREQKTQRFYKMLINWRLLGFPMRDMVDQMVSYWNTLNGDSAIVYVGKWGGT